jgi:hypothetical protein
MTATHQRFQGDGAGSITGGADAGDGETWIAGSSVLLIVADTVAPDLHVRTAHGRHTYSNNARLRSFPRELVLDGSNQLSIGNVQLYSALDFQKGKTAKSSTIVPAAATPSRPTFASGGQMRGAVAPRRAKPLVYNEIFASQSCGVPAK